MPDLSLLAGLWIGGGSIIEIHTDQGLSGIGPAIDNGSLNGTFVNGRRVPVVDIHDGQTVNIGNPDGPQLTFEVGRHQGMAGRPRRTESMGIPVAAHAGGTAWPASQAGQPGPPLAAPPGRACRRRDPA